MDNNQVSDNLVGYAPSVDAIQEFNEITQNAPAEFGNFMGAIVSTSIKSGTNQYHGDAFEFFRNDVSECQFLVEQLQRRRQGETALERIRRHPGRPDQERQAVLLRRLPRAALRYADQHRRHQRADIGRSAAATSPRCCRARIPSSFTIRSVSSGGQRVPFAGNIIPANLLNPVAQKIVSDTSAYPLPTGSGLINNYLYATHTDDQRRSGRRQGRLERHR